VWSGRHRSHGANLWKNTQTDELWFLLGHHRAKFDVQRHRFDILVRYLGREKARPLIDASIADGEIMVVMPTCNEAKNLDELLKEMSSEINGKNSAYSLWTMEAGMKPQKLYRMQAIWYYVTA